MNQKRTWLTVVCEENGVDLRELEVKVRNHEKPEFSEGELQVLAAVLQHAKEV